MKFERFLMLIILFLLALGHQVAAQTCTPPPSGMVGWYPGDGNANDISVVGNHATTVNGATFAAGMVQMAFSLDGVNDYFEAPDKAQQDLTTTATLDAWVLFNQKPSVAGHIMVIISKQAPGNDFDLGALTDDRFYLYIANGNNVASTTIIQTGVWYHVAGTWDATGLRIYVNGVLENTNPTPGIVRNATAMSPLRIGEGSLFTGRNFSGLIDEAEIIGRALSGPEVLAIFNAGSAGKCKAPVTAAAVSIGGRVINSSGYGIGKARVILYSSDGGLKTALTNPFGYFTISDLTAGSTYIISVTAKGYAFKRNPQFISVADNLDDVSFVSTK